MSSVDFIRDHAMYAVTFGLFSASWFGWAQENPPGSWRPGLTLASGLCLLVACLGGYLAFKHWSGASALNAPGVYQKFGIVVVVEVIAIAAGAAILRWLGKPELLPSWATLVVGIHLVPLVAVFQDRALYILALMLITVAAMSAILTRRVDIAAGTLAGVGAGSSLLLFAMRGLFLAIA